MSDYDVLVPLLARAQTMLITSDAPGAAALRIEIMVTLATLVSPVGANQGEALRQRAAFMAGHLAAQDQTDRYGETHETPEEAYTAWLATQPKETTPETWQPIETAPQDRLIVVYAPGREGLQPMASLCQWHPDAGFCIDELREPTHWMEQP